VYSATITQIENAWVSTRNKKENWLCSKEIHGILKDLDTVLVKLKTSRKVVIYLEDGLVASPV
jgi:hypothetical protein